MEGPGEVWRAERLVIPRQQPLHGRPPRPAGAVRTGGGSGRFLDCVFYGQPGVFVSHDVLDSFAGDPRATHPHFAYTSQSAPQALHNVGRLAWGSGPPGDKPNCTGLDVIVVRDDKIATLYVFLDSEPS